MSHNTRIGTEIAGYRLERRLGQGAFASVYVAEHIQLGKKVAIKVLDPELARDEDMSSRFIAESRIAAELDHPGIIHIEYAGQQDGLLFIVMKYVQGRDLDTLIREQGTLSATRASSIIDQVAGGLDAAHSKGLVHRDIKPQNILIEDHTERAYVIDFGIVRRNLVEGMPADARSYSRIGFKGTPYYASPEQIETNECDARTDVYGLGGVAYTCLTGMAPYQHLNEYAAMLAHVSEPPPSVTAARPGLPYTLDTVISTAMAKHPADRYRSCGEFARELRAAAHGRHVRGGTHEPSGEVNVPAAAPGPETVLSSPPAPTTAPAVPLAPVAAGRPADHGGPPTPGSGKGDSGSHGDGGSGGGYGSGGGPSGRHSGGGLSGSPRWLVALAGLGVVAILALALVGAYELGKGDDGPAADTATHDTTGGMTTMDESGGGHGANNDAVDAPKGATANQIKLWASIPKPIRKSNCTLVSPPEHAQTGGLATANCSYDDPNHGKTLLHVDYLDSRASLVGLYTLHGVSEVKARGFTPHPDSDTVTLRCNATNWLSEGPWRHEGLSDATPPAGREACYQTAEACDLVAKMKLMDDAPGKGCSIAVWTNYDNTLFVKAEQQTRAHSNLAAFVKYWRHSFGAL
jgi:tRNA A-37 threonylcarbamoyl transferase component Bud32